MKRILLLSILLFLITTSVFSQHTKDTTWVRKTYVRISDYKEKFKDPLTKKDSINFRFKDNDTLVLVVDHMKPNSTSVPYEYKDSTFLHYYKKIAFNHKSDSVNHKTAMKYWKDDIRIFFSESVSRKTKKDLMAFAKSIDNAVDSLHISEVKNVEDSNYVIYYFGDYDYETKMTFYKNSADYSWWQHNRIYKHSIKIDPKKFFSEHLIQNRLRSDFVKSLGYFNLIDDLECNSYFSNCFSSNKVLTPLDIEIIKYHYSYGICKGTSLETFEEQHKQAQNILKETGHLMHFFHSFETQ